MNLINGDCLEVLCESTNNYDCIFADPPDGIGLGYNSYDDKTDEADYRCLLRRWLFAFTQKAPIIWLSFNARWTIAFGRVVDDFLSMNSNWEAKPCVQVFTFGQHRDSDLGNNHRPLWRIKRKDAPIYPDQIRVPSWRQRNGDKRASAKGRVPGDVFDMQYPMPGDVFDFPRVTGNSKQRCDWHPTQLHEELVERCIKLSTLEDQRVLDPFGGTGTTMRVSKQINRDCTLIELDPEYCRRIAADNGLTVIQSAQAA